MSPKSKTVLIIFVTFIIGVALGAVGAGTYRYMFDSRRPGPPYPDNHVERIMRLLDLKDSQEDTVRTILENHSERMRINFQESMKYLEASIDSLEDELAPVLTEEQLARLKEERKKFENVKRDWQRPNKDRTNPPGPVDRR
ncbi:MAG: hypothetical protein ACOYVF_02050 [Candidatus Zixiibacteriota bacterium]